MRWQQLKERWRRDGWLLAALAGAVALCLLLGATSSSPASTALESRLSRVLSAMDGAGRVEAAVFYQEEGDARPTGAVIVAEGAQDVAVRLQLTRAVCTLLGLEASQVDVFPAEGGR